MHRVSLFSSGGAVCLRGCVYVCIGGLVVVVVVVVGGVSGVWGKYYAGL